MRVWSALCIAVGLIIVGCSPGPGERTGSTPSPAEPTSSPAPQPDKVTQSNTGLSIVVRTAESNQFAKVTLERASWKPLGKHELMFTDRKNHKWTELPVEFTEMSFACRAAHDATAELRVEQSGWVFLAIKSTIPMRANKDTFPELTQLAEMIDAGWARHPRFESVSGASHDWHLYRRLCLKGESFSYRMERYTAPIIILRENAGELVVPTPDGWADIRIEGAVYKPIGTGTLMYRDRDQYRWSQVPAGMIGMSFLYGAAQAARVEFEIVKDGWVYMAITERSRNSRPSGDLQDLTPVSKIQADGWVHQPRLGALNGANHRWILFQRMCKAGEEFSYRTERYTAPMIITKP